MAFGSALVDRARIVRNTPQPRKVDGRTQFAQVAHPWFRCRLTIGPRPRTADPSGTRTRAESRPTLLYGLRDEEGQDLDLTIEDQVEVDSPELGRGFWKLDGAPQPLRKRRTLLGWEVTLRRIEKPEFEPRTV